MSFGQKCKTRLRRTCVRRTPIPLPGGFNTRRRIQPNPSEGRTGEAAQQGSLELISCTHHLPGWTSFWTSGVLRLTLVTTVIPLSTIFSVIVSFLIAFSTVFTPL